MSGQNYNQISTDAKPRIKIGVSTDVRSASGLTLDCITIRVRLELGPDCDYININTNVNIGIRIRSGLTLELILTFALELD